MFYVKFTGIAQSLISKFETRKEAEDHYRDLSESGENPIGWEEIDGQKIDLHTGEEIEGE